MQGNDLDSTVVPRDILVFEGLLGLFENDRARSKFDRYRTRKKWSKAMDCFTFNPILCDQIWHLTVHYSVEIEVITYLGKEFRDVLEPRIEEEGLPIRRVEAVVPHVYARSLAHRLDVRTVYDPYPEHQFMYGGRGRFLPHTDATKFGVL